MPLQETSGTASYDAFGGGVAVIPNYIEDVFSTYLYTGNNTQRSISNGIDLSTKGGLVWLKSRSTASYPNHTLWDTARGISKYIQSDTTNAQASSISGATYYGVNAFNTDGFSLGPNWLSENETNVTYASWTFRKQPKFFDVVTYTGTGSNRTIAHSLGAVPGAIWVKRTDATADWQCYHRSLANTEYMVLNSTAAKATGATRWNSTTPTSAVFSIGTNSTVNASGGTYVAYVFAHDAGGFGLTGTDNVISCGSFTADGSGNFSVNLGYEPQWILAKQATGSANNWAIFDNMRGMSNTNVARLIPNLSAAEDNYASPYCVPSATGFYSNSGGFFDASQTVIYIAIRRGPMKVPTDATKVFAPATRAGTGANATVTGAGFPVDMTWIKDRTSAYGNQVYDRLRGAGFRLGTYGTFGEQVDTTTGLTSFASMTGFSLGNDSTNIGVNRSGDNFIDWNFQRAPSFFDEVCYTGTGNGSSSNTVNHNLGVIPELCIFKCRSNSSYGQWGVSVKFSSTNWKTGYLYLTDAFTNEGDLSSFSPSTSTTIRPFYLMGGNGYPTVNGETYVAYLFATCAGVSKVGSYTGTGTTKQIDCGFTAGSRFVLIKRTDSTGDWYVWDSARGIVAGNDPYLLLNSTAAEVTNTDYVDTYSAGFEISSTAPAAINANGGSFIFFAVA